MLMRALSAADVSLFRDLRLRALACDPDAYGGTYAAESARSEAEWSEGLRKGTSGTHAIFVALDSARAIGMCGAFMTDDDAAVGMIWGMFVEPSFRGSSVARELLCAAEHFLRQCGAARVIGRVADGNSRAIAFYRRCGYALGPACGPLRSGSPMLVYPIERTLP
jgi:GNAT superfamily N-acetyltransferase